MRLWHDNHVHHSQEDFDECERLERRTKRISIAILLALAILALAADLAWNQYVYGDWRCAFAQCRLEKSK